MFLGTIAERQPKEKEDHRTQEDHPEDAQRVRAEKRDRRRCSWDVVADKAVVPPGDRINDSEKENIGEGESGAVEEIPKRGSETIHEQDVSEREDNKSVVDPKDPEAEGRWTIADGGSQERPDIKPRPEVDHALEESEFSQDRERTKNVGDVTEVKGKALA